MRYHVYFAIALGVVAGCRLGAPSASHQWLLDRQQAVEKLIQSERAGYAHDVAMSRVPELATIAARERVSDSFGEAEQLLLRGRTCVGAGVDDHDDETGAGECRLLYDRAEGAARAPRLVIAAWTRLWQDARERGQEAIARVNATEQTIAAAVLVLEASVQDNVAAYPARRGDLEARLAALRRIPRDLAITLAKLDVEVRANANGNGDVAALERGFAAVDATVARSHSELAELQSRLQELDRDDETRLVRLEKSTVGGEQVFTSTLRVLRDGVVQPDTVVPIDAVAFTSYLMMALGVQRTFPALDIVKTRPVPAATALCADRLVVDVDLVLEHKPNGQYDEEAARSPSPAVLGLGHVGDTTYGSWQPRDNGRTAWQFDAMWLKAHPGSPEIRDEEYARYSAWRFDNGFACGFDRAGARTGAPASCVDPRAGQIAESLLAFCAPPPAPDPDTVVTVRGAGPRMRARGMGGGGK